MPHGNGYASGFNAVEQSGFRNNFKFAMAPHDSIFNQNVTRESLIAVEHVLTSQTKGLALGLTLGDGSRVLHNGSLNQEMEAWLCEMAADEREVP